MPEFPVGMLIFSCEMLVMVGYSILPSNPIFASTTLTTLNGYAPIFLTET
jgi:hypothetical protein